MDIALISCGKAKRDGTHAAQNLYNGSYFKQALAYAQKHFDATYILSAYYGLLTLDQKVDSYDLIITQLSKEQRKRWGLAVAKQIRYTINKNDNLYFLAGEEYCKPLLPYFPNATVLFKGMRIGERKRAYLL